MTDPTDLRAIAQRRGMTLAEPGAPHVLWRGVPVIQCARTVCERPARSLEHKHIPGNRYCARCTRAINTANGEILVRLPQLTAADQAALLPTG